VDPLTYRKRRHLIHLNPIRGVLIWSNEPSRTGQAHRCSQRRTSPARQGGVIDRASLVLTNLSFGTDRVLVPQGEIYTGDGICAGHGWCPASGDRSGLTLSGRGRQMPEFHGLSGRMGAVLARPSDFDSIGSTLACFRLAGNRVGIVGCCRRQRIMDVKCDVADRRAFPIVGPGWCGISAWN
jgi:hypothetical protein